MSRITLMIRLFIGALILLICAMAGIYGITEILATPATETQPCPGTPAECSPTLITQCPQPDTSTCQKQLGD